MLKLILGTMKSGKSLRLLDEAFLLIKKSYPRKANFIIIRNSKDTREFFTRSSNYEDFIFHFGDEKTSLEPYDNIFIDEVQFFDKSYVNKIIKLSFSKDIFVAGLKADVKNKIWANVAKLIPYADDIIYPKAHCDKCGESPACFHLGNGKIGNDYLVLCKQCYKEGLK